jgi:hypothetical protein
MPPVVRQRRIPAADHAELHLMPAILIAHHDPIGLGHELIGRRINVADGGLGPFHGRRLVAQSGIQRCPGRFGRASDRLRAHRDPGQRPELHGGRVERQQRPQGHEPGLEAGAHALLGLNPERLIAGTPARMAGRALGPGPLPAHRATRRLDLPLSPAAESAERPTHRAARAIAPHARIEAALGHRDQSADELRGQGPQPQAHGLLERGQIRIAMLRRPEHELAHERVNRCHNGVRKGRRLHRSRAFRACSGTVRGLGAPSECRSLAYSPGIPPACCFGPSFVPFFAQV